jgi:hypothetical protein
LLRLVEPGTQVINVESSTESTKVWAAPFVQLWIQTVHINPLRVLPLQGAALPQLMARLGHASPAAMIYHHARTELDHAMTDALSTAMGEMS